MEKRRIMGEWGGMRDLAEAARERVDAQLAEIENNLLADTTLDWQSIRPELTDQAEYDRLMAIVNESTQRNESIGQLVDRVKALGAGGADLLAKVKKFVV